MLGMGPILWREANRLMHNNPKASGVEPVSRIEAGAVDDPYVDTPKWRHRSPAAWWYYKRLDEINRGASTVPGEQK
jgi:hypothetical protein